MTVERLHKNGNLNLLVILVAVYKSELKNGEQKLEKAA